MVWEYDKRNDELIRKLVTERHISKSSGSGYYSTMKKYLEFHNEPLMQTLIDEALQEEDERIPQRKRKLRQRLLDYRSMLAESGMSQRSVKSYTLKLRSIYRHYGCELPTLPPLKMEKEYEVSYYDLPTKKHLRQVVTDVPLDMKAIILFMSSSGTAKAETLSLTVGMFLDSVNEYYDTNKTLLKDILEELKPQNDIVPIFYLRRIKTDKYYYTCCSPEATKAIVYYLLDRMNYEVINDNSKLFDFTSSLLLTKFQEINDYYEWGFVGRFRFFRAHVLRKFHASNIGLPAEQVDVFQGRSPNEVHSTYIKTNPQELVKLYRTVMSNVMLFKPVTEVKENVGEDNSLLSPDIPKGNSEDFVDLNFHVPMNKAPFVLETVQKIIDN